jgi:hypothetical protein
VKRNASNTTAKERIEGQVGRLNWLLFFLLFLPFFLFFQLLSLLFLLLFPLLQVREAEAELAAILGPLATV